MSEPFEPASKEGGTHIVGRVRQAIRRCAVPVCTQDGTVADELALRQRLGALCDAMRAELEEWRHMGARRLRRVSLVDGDRYAVIGDLHGDFSAMQSILEVLFPAGLSEAEARKVHLLFVGDIVDRGPMDLELLHLLFELKRILGERVLLLRGNHEQFRVDRQGRFATKVHGGEELFVNRYGPYLSSEQVQCFVEYFENAPHVAILENARGRGMLVHAGVPPAYLARPHDAIESMLDEPNLVEAFLWGRGPRAGARPARPYVYDVFFEEDVVEFCERFDLSWLIRGHDSQRRGCSVKVDGRCITVFSSGVACGNAPTQSAYAISVELPRYLVLVPEYLFSERQRWAEAAEPLDAGIQVREVFLRDVIVDIQETLPSPQTGLLLQLAHDVCAELQEHGAFTFYVRRGEQLFEALKPFGARAYDRNLDAVTGFRYPRVTLGVGENGAMLCVEVRGEAHQAQESLAAGLAHVREEYEAFVARCADHIARATLGHTSATVDSP